MRRRQFLAAAVAVPAVARRPFFQRGVNFTAEMPDKYDSDRARQLLTSLPEYGINAVALVPYGFTPNGSPLVRFGGEHIWERDRDILALAALARRQGIQVMLKPQIWVRHGYPGSLDFPSPSDRSEWFRQYSVFVDHYAMLANEARAAVFVIGVEFARLSREEREWRTLIARARENYHGAITYAATQGEEFESIRFWDALDYIGLNNYYPLPDDLATDAVVRKVEAVQRRFNRPVIFPEAGFCSFAAPHRAPWDETPRAISLDEQARCYDAIFRAFYRKPWFQGMYWWKVGSNGRGGASDGSHTPWGKPAMHVVQKWYKGGGR